MILLLLLFSLCVCLSKAAAHRGSRWRREWTPPQTNHETTSVGVKATEGRSLTLTSWKLGCKYETPTALDERPCFYPQDNDFFFPCTRWREWGSMTCLWLSVELCTVTAAGDCMLLGLLPLYVCFKHFLKAPGVPLGSARENKCLILDS